MADNLGSYKITLVADYSGLSKSVQAAMKAIVDKTQTATNAVNKMSEQIDRSMQGVSASMTQASAKIGEQADVINQKLSTVGKGAGLKKDLFAGVNFDQQAAGVDKVNAAIQKAGKSGNALTDIIRKVGHHAEWMGAAALVVAPLAGLHSLVKIEEQMAGMKQVLPSLQNDQQKMNQATREFIDIAGQYGVKVEDLIESAKLWGRAYKDINEVEALLHSSSILAVADSFSLTEANKALEATMMQYGMRARNAAEATQFSMKIVDSWTNVAHNAIVSAQDLAAANERSASAARQAGVSFDFLQGMIGTMSRNTGRPGAEMGNAIRSMLASIHTKKAIDEIEKMGVSMYEVGEDGTKSFRNVEKVLLNLMVTSDATDKNIEKLMMSISGGKFQYNKVASLIGDYNELIRVTELSINSQGVAHHQAEMQIDTLARKLERMRDLLQGVVMSSGNSGLTQWLKGVIDNINVLIQRISTIPAGNWEIIGQAIKLSVALKAGMVVLNTARGAYTSYTTAINTATAAKILNTGATNAGTAAAGASAAAKGAETAATISLTAAERALALARGLATGGLSLLIGGIISVATGYALMNTQSAEAFKVANDQRTAEEKLTAQLQDKESATNSEIEVLKNKIRFAENLASVYPRLIENEIASRDNAVQNAKDKEKLMTTEKALTSMLGSEAVERIKSSSDVKKATDDEIAKLKEKQEKLDEVLRLERQAIIDHSTATIKKANERLDAIKAETMGLATEAQKQIAIYQSINSAKLAALSGRAEGDQRDVEASTERLHAMLSAKESGAPISERAINSERKLQDALVVRAGKSAAEYKAAMDREGSSVLAERSKAIEALRTAQGTTIPGGTTGSGGTVDGSDSSGKGETAYQKAKYAFEAEAAKREADAALAGFKYTQAEKLALMHKYLDDVEKLEDGKHHEQTDWKKLSYTEEYKKQREEIELTQAKMQTAIAQEKATKIDAFEFEIRKQKEVVANELTNSVEKERALQKLASEEKQYAKYKMEVATKEREINQQLIKERQRLADIALDQAEKLGMITPKQKIQMQQATSKANYQDQVSAFEFQAGSKSSLATDGNEEKFLALYRQYMAEKDQLRQADIAKELRGISIDYTRTQAFLKQSLQARADYTAEATQLENRLFIETHKWQKAAVDGLRNGINSAFDGLIEKTVTIGQAIKNVFKSVFKSIASSIGNDFANKWAGTLSGILLGTRKTTSRITSSWQQSGQAQQQASYGAAAVQDQLNSELAQKFAQMCNMEVFTNQAKNDMKKASDTAQAASSKMNFATMMTDMLALLAIMLVVSALFGGGGSSESTSTAAVSLGRNPASYYSTPAAVSIPSFDVGTMYVPEDMLANVHKGEAILPTSFADDFRSMVSGNSSRTTSIGKIPIISNVSAIDTRGMKQAIMESSEHIASAVRKELRKRNINLG